MSESSIKPIANQAYDYLFQKIVRCDYFPGQEINEKQIIEETGFGRTPLREALLLLQNDGLVEIFPRKGMRISVMTEKSVNDLYQARKIIEPQVIDDFKGFYSKGKLMKYRTQFENSRPMKDLDRFFLDSEFHSYLISVTGNRTLTDMYGTLMAATVRLAMYATFTPISDCRNEDIDQHLAIIDALLCENSKDIRDAVIFHLNRSMIRSHAAVSALPFK